MPSNTVDRMLQVIQYLKSRGTETRDGKQVVALTDLMRVIELIAASNEKIKHKYFIMMRDWKVIKRTDDPNYWEIDYEETAKLMFK